MKQILLFITIAILAGCFGVDPQKTGKEGKPLPEFSLLLTDSISKMHSKDILSGKPFVLLYFSPSCPYCKAQTKSIIENMDNLKDVHFYYISSYPLSTVKEFYHNYGLSKFPNITVGIDSAHVIYDYFEVPAFPYIAVYGKDKKLKKSFIGKMYTRQIKEETEK